MQCSAFIASSADGYIATEEGGVEWLELAGNTQVDMVDQEDMGFAAFMATIDCMIIGRKCMEKLSNFDLSPEQWPYGDRRIIVLSKTLAELPDNMKRRAELYGGEIHPLIERLTHDGLTHAYVDGGTTITSFINLQLMTQLIVTQVPVLLGKGLPLFGELNNTTQLRQAQAHVYPNDFIQTRYTVDYGAA